jgi:large subunit ribosomal protein L21
MMRYAIIESGGKQYRAVEGQEFDVDRLAAEAGGEISLDRVLMMVDEAEFMVGTPTVAGIEIRASVVDHVLGRKVTHFRYSPKKRIRVRGGHRQQYTRLRVEFIGRKGEVRKSPKAEAQTAEIAPAAENVGRTASAPVPKAAAKKVAAKKAPAKKQADSGKSTGRKPGK